MIDLNGLHRRPAGYKGRVLGRKYIEIGKWLIITGIVVLFARVFLERGTGRHDVGDWPIYLGLSAFCFLR